jgi:hypothetical protein
VAFTPDDLVEVAGCAATAWRAGAGRDWEAPAGTLTWSCAHTADHAVDATLAPAFFLASRRRADYPPYGAATPGPDASPEEYAEALLAAARLLAALVTATEPDARAIIWRRPALEVRGPADFAPRGGLELVLHAHDVCAGLGIPFTPPADPCDRLRRHTHDWPHWRTPGWAPLALSGDPWADLLHASGRRPSPPA